MAIPIGIIISVIIIVTMFKKEIATTKELDLRPLGKVIIFRDKQMSPWDPTDLLDV